MTSPCPCARPRSTPRTSRSSTPAPCRSWRIPTRPSKCRAWAIGRRAGLEEQVATGIVLTGGSSKMEGAIELAEEVFHMPVRLGVPQYVSGLVDVVSNPIHATGVGLLLYAKGNLEGSLARDAP